MEEENKYASEEEREPDIEDSDESDSEFWGVPRFRWSPGLGPQVIRRRAPPLQPPSPPQVPGFGDEDSDLPDEWIGVSKNQVVKILETLPELGVPFELPSNIKKMSREQLIDIARERYGEELDETVRSARTAPGGRIRVGRDKIKKAFSSIIEYLSSYRRGGQVRRSSGAF